ncbi:ATP-binding domain-containing protein [Nostoc sp. FACHB-892]|uniref:DEAD/DEAH box helicase n=1 Tax=Nostoc sp. FACHB-892 TaxID=2692843 RepID=UPI0016875875|nr:ATP-binding domain-containing protein [Nostoc sp. FACHB-892]MBD2730239.1 ATP-binding domain-containing protein [Nostoc sp. FACHB-892]
MSDRFITIELTGEPGEKAEQIVWDAMCKAFKQKAEQEECLAYWQYPLFPSKYNNFLKRPDILIADKELGLIVIEVKGIRIEDLKGIQGDYWLMKPGFYSPSIQPYKQAEKQLRAVTGHFNLIDDLWNQVLGRAMVALPYITRKQWQEKSFTQIAAKVPIIFGDELAPKDLLKIIRNSSLVIPGNKLNKTQWIKLELVISGKAVPDDESLVSPESSLKQNCIEKLNKYLYEIDIKQEHIGKTIPPGVQRFSGIAGSGKTVLLCQKAANMHLKHPDWDIALIFFTRSLYNLIIKEVNFWLHQFSDGEVQYDPTNSNSKLKILHAWGVNNVDNDDQGSKQPGFYSLVKETHNIGTVLDGPHPTFPKLSPPEKLAYLCKQILLNHKIQPMFDAILIDEGMDLVVDSDEIKFEGKQPIFWLAWQTLRPVTPEKQEQRRLIWTYDMAQSLDALKVPTAKELFGQELGASMLKGQYPGGIKKSEVMSRCHRTPGPILTMAHGIGMGLLRKEGMLTGLTTKKEWQDIGYEVTGDFRKIGQVLVVSRSSENSCNPIPSLWTESPLIKFETYKNREEELKVLANQIRANLEYDLLKPSHDILIVVLGDNRDAQSLEQKVAKALISNKIDIFIPSALEPNILNPIFPNTNANNFWYEGAVTVSRIHRAKGNEANMVYIVGLDNIASNESDIKLRNQLFVALTRSRAWVNLSGVDGNHPFYEELRKVMESGNSFQFEYYPPKVDIGETIDIR